MESDTQVQKEADRIFVVGAGSWGTALSLVLSKNGYTVDLWDADTKHVQSLINDSCNKRHLPGIPFPKTLNPVEHFKTDATDVILVVPCEAIEGVLNNLSKNRSEKLRICIASKGLTPGKTTLNHEIVSKVLGDIPVAILTGPSFASEVANELPTAVTIASTSHDTANWFANLFHNEYFRIYTHDDVIGVQVGGAVKNVMAIAAGISDGLDFGANTRAAVITRGLAEITRLGVAMGANKETFMGLAGLGDLVLTCTDNQSRNRRLGIALAQGSSLEQARASIGQAIEGVRTAEAVISLAEKYQVDMPISKQIYLLVNGKISPKDAVNALLMREPKPEWV
jgi:glycerol-3-phosphate dehydrogenase (NAD(P)+)